MSVRVVIAWRRGERSAVALLADDGWLVWVEKDGRWQRADMFPGTEAEAVEAAMDCAGPDRMVDFGVRTDIGAAPLERPAPGHGG